MYKIQNVYYLGAVYFERNAIGRSIKLNISENKPKFVEEVAFCVHEMKISLLRTDFTQPGCVETRSRDRSDGGEKACRMSMGNWRFFTYLSSGGGAGDVAGAAGTSCAS
jgi:hypothetical protein